jgi:hypothetical protein
MKRPKIPRGGIGHRPGDDKCKKETDGGQEEAPPRTIRNMLVEQLSDAGMVEEQQDERGGN